MMKMPVVVGASPASRDTRTAPLTGVVVGTGISLVMWAMILGIVFAIR